MATREKTGGRSKGTPNKTTALLKEAILLAAEEHGLDGQGDGGLKGYLSKVASDDMKAFCTLLGKVLPLQVEGSGDAVEIIFTTVYESRQEDGPAR